MPVTRKTPFRPRTDEKITQAYNDGVVTVYTVTDDNAGTGYAPKAVTTELITLAYQERKLGISRYYDAKQNQTEVQRVIRVQKPAQPITNQDVARTEDGVFYRIDLVQALPGVYPPSLDLTLVLFTQGVPETEEPEEPAEPTDPTDPETPAEEEVSGDGG